MICLKILFFKQGFILILGDKDRGNSAILIKNALEQYKKFKNEVIMVRSVKIKIEVYDGELLQSKRFDAIFDKIF